jgi:Glycosyl hydrolases family 38 N-terminal domain
MREHKRDHFPPNSILKEHFGWKMAICQHPMYLLIDEDRGEPIVGERVPPWGAPDAEEYVKRVEGNLNSLDNYPDLKLNYQFSGVEMESMAHAFPGTVARIKEMYEKGVLDFVGGSFSQPHFQILDSESNWRQFEYGLKVFKKLFGKEIQVYARQETGLHHQLPQILKYFGFEIMVAPLFPWAFEILEGPLEMTAFSNGIYPMQGDEFLNAVALDGTYLPFYFKVIEASLGIDQERLNNLEIHKDLYAGPPVWTYFPDMVAINDREYEKFKELFDFALLEN